ncbi:MAG: Uma2 family endonuclease [Gemmataceae bacterium]|nr:Uma2 family endonuclease [Gemmataceae bacterium]
MQAAADPFAPPVPPDHTELPCEDGKPMVNTQEHPQSSLLTDTLDPRLSEIHGADNFFIGADAGIFWWNTRPALEGCKAPDWFVVPGVPPLLEGVPRRSYVLWNEGARPFLAVEYVSGDGTEEHDPTPRRGKFWVYERGIVIPYYFIFDGSRETLEGWQLVKGAYQRMTPNQHGRYPVAELRIELGLWRGTYRHAETVWLRPWDADTGELMPVSSERAELAEASIDHFREAAEEATEQALQERKRADEATRWAEQAAKDAEDERGKVRLLRERLRAAGLDPDA